MSELSNPKIIRKSGWSTVTLTRGAGVISVFNNEEFVLQKFLDRDGNEVECAEAIAMNDEFDMDKFIRGCVCARVPGRREVPRI